VREGERPIAQIAHDLGIAESCLRRWIKQAELDRGERDDGLGTGDREELRRGIAHALSRGRRSGRR
jgi:transposase